MHPEVAESRYSTNNTHIRNECPSVFDTRSFDPRLHKRSCIVGSGGSDSYEKQFTIVLAKATWQNDLHLLFYSSSQRSAGKLKRFA